MREPSTATTLASSPSVATTDSTATRLPQEPRIFATPSRLFSSEMLNDYWMFYRNNRMTEVERLLSLSVTCVRPATLQLLISAAGGEIDQSLPGSRNGFCWKG